MSAQDPNYPDVSGGGVPYPPAVAAARTANSDTLAEQYLADTFEQDESGWSPGYEREHMIDAFTAGMEAQAARGHGTAAAEPGVAMAAGFAFGAAGDLTGLKAAAAAQPASGDDCPCDCHDTFADAAAPREQPAPAAAPGVAARWELPPDPSADELRLAAEADQLREQLARLRNEVGSVIISLELSAKATAPSKKSDIELDTAGRLRGLL